MDRQKTPDILGSIMSGQAIKEESNKPVEQYSNNEIKQAIVKEIKKESGKAIKQASNKNGPTQLFIDGTEESLVKVEDELKEKATFNLPVKLLEELEDKCHELRKMCGSKQVTKTLIVEEALRMAFAEFDLKKDIGKFYSKLASNKGIKRG